MEDPGYTSAQIAEMLKVSRVSVTKYLKALKENGFIERMLHSIEIVLSKYIIKHKMYLQKNTWLL